MCLYCFYIFNLGEGNGLRTGLICCIKIIYFPLFLTFSGLACQPFASLIIQKWSNFMENSNHSLLHADA